jgi:hypothetical protein
MMPTNEQTIRVYQELADWYERQGQAKLRDWFLVLAADAALTLGRADEAERLRGRLLGQNPHHLLRPYQSLAEAMKAPDVQNYIADLRRSYPPEAAEHMLQQLRAGAPGKQPERAPAAEKLNPPRPPQGVGPPPDEPERELKVYRLQATTQEVPTEPPPRPAGRPPAKVPAAASPPRPTAPLPRPRPTPTAPATTPTPPAGVTIASEAEEKDAAAVFWVSMVLCGMTLVVGVGLAVYTLLRPFLPQEWFH